MSLSKACRTCSVCWTGGVATHPRILAIHSHVHVPNAPILVIDDMPHGSVADDKGWDRENVDYQDHYWQRIVFTREALDRVTHGIPYVYCQAIRCQTEVIADSPINPRIACAVWTHNLLEGRKVIMSGEHGFKQMEIKQPFELWKRYRTPRVGSVFTISPTDLWHEDYGIPTIEAKFDRVLKEAKLL